LFVGNGSPSKGLDLLVDAMAVVRRRRPDTVLACTLEPGPAHTSRQMVEIEQRIDAAGLRADTFRFGIVRDLPALMQASDVVAVPYRNTEGPSDVPIAMLEAMALGRPIVATEVGGIGEVIADDSCGVLARPDVDGLADGILRVLAAPDGGQSLGERGRVAVTERYGVSRIADEVVRIYDELQAAAPTRAAARSSALFYSREAHQYDDRRWRTPQGVRNDAHQKRIVGELLGPIAGQRVLEIGPGTGRLSSWLADRGASLIGADVARPMLERLRARMPAAHAVQAEGCRLPCASESVDACVSINVFSHLMDPDAVLREIERVLRPGGIVVVNIPHVWSLYLPAALCVNLRSRALGRAVYTRWYTLRSFTRTVRAAGLAVERISGTVHVPDGLARLGMERPLRWLDERMTNTRWRHLCPTLFVRASKPVVAT
jgi:ubiquinone/menaquinone biosynthesis C-methylase UbiE